MKINSLLQMLPLQFAMDYSAEIKVIRAERLELVEFLGENHLQWANTLIYVANTSSLMLQNVTGVLEIHYHLQQDVYLMKPIWTQWNKNSCSNFVKSHNNIFNQEKP